VLVVTQMEQRMTSLAGKRAFITGGSRGIGAGIARRLAADGADVAITYERSAERAAAVVQEIQQRGRRALALRVDSRDSAALKRAIDEVARTLGGIDILVNNAGLFKAGPLEELTDEDVDSMLAVNVRAVIGASRAAAVHMGEGGRIISIGSCLAGHTARPGVSLYAMSKAALSGWTQGLARDLGPRGITVNIIHPGPTDTEMNPANGPAADTQRSRMAIPRYGTPEDIAALVAFVASPESRYITGAGIASDGGINA
jgi:3-oxoacyl-[acyl-carrier protein] reductase